MRGLSMKSGVKKTKICSKTSMKENQLSSLMKKSQPKLRYSKITQSKNGQYEFSLQLSDGPNLRKMDLQLSVKGVSHARTLRRRLIKHLLSSVTLRFAGFSTEKSELIRTSL